MCKGPVAGSRAGYLEHMKRFKTHVTERQVGGDLEKGAQARPYVASHSGLKI